MIQPGDKLRLDHINSLPQPFTGVFIGGDEWPIEDIDVQTGLLRIDVGGKLQVMHIAEVRHFVDANGVAHVAESFYVDYEPDDGQSDAAHYERRMEACRE